MPPEVTEKTAHLLGCAMVVYTGEPGQKKPTCRAVPLTANQQRSLLHFVQHRLHGGRLTLMKLPEEKRIISL